MGTSHVARVGVVGGTQNACGREITKYTEGLKLTKRQFYTFTDDVWDSMEWNGGMGWNGMQWWNGDLP